MRPVTEITVLTLVHNHAVDPGALAVRLKLKVSLDSEMGEQVEKMPSEHHKVKLRHVPKLAAGESKFYSRAISLLLQRIRPRGRGGSSLFVWIWAWGGRDRSCRKLRG